MEAVNRTLTYLYSHPEARLAATAGLIVAALIIVWFLLRNVRLWYWKTEKVLKALSDIETRLMEMEHSLDRIKINMDGLSKNRMIENKVEEKEEKRRQIEKNPGFSSGVASVAGLLAEMERERNRIENMITEEEVNQKIRD